MVFLVKLGSLTSAVTREGRDYTLRVPDELVITGGVDGSG